MENKTCSKPPTSVSSYATGSFWGSLHADTKMRKNRFETWLGRGAAMVIPPIQPFRKDLISVAK